MYVHPRRGAFRLPWAVKRQKAKISGTGDPSPTDTGLDTPEGRVKEVLRFCSLKKFPKIAKTLLHF